MKTKTAYVLAASALALPLSATAELVLYNGEGFHGRSTSITQNLGDLQAANFNDRASSVVVLGDRWEACEDAQFHGRCIVLRPGRYPSLSAMGLNDRISSVRPLGEFESHDNEAPSPGTGQAYEYRHRANERTYEVPVTSVHAVVGPPEGESRKHFVGIADEVAVGKEQELDQVPDRLVQGARRFGSGRGRAVR